MCTFQTASLNNIKHNNTQYMVGASRRWDFCSAIVLAYITLCWFSLHPLQMLLYLIKTPEQPCTYRRSLTATVYCSVFCNNQTQLHANTLAHLSSLILFLEKRLNFPYSHFHRAPYLTVGRERNKQWRAASASLSDLKFIKYIKPGPAPSGNICNPKLCFLLLPPASSCHKHST